MEAPKSLQVEDHKYIREDLIEKESVFIPQEGEIYQLGQKYYIRTVTHHYVGRLVQKDEKDFVMGECSWIADSGRWSNALATGTLDEVEPYPGQAIINRGAICDSSVWNHPLPKDIK